MDGASGVQFFAAFNDITPTPEPAQQPALWQPESTPSNLHLLGKAYVNNLRKPVQMLRMGGGVLASRRRISRGIKQGDFRELGDIPTTCFNGKLSPHRVVGATKFDFESVRQIKNLVKGATINDAVLAIVGGALRRYLSAWEELPEESLVTGCPVNVRDEREAEAGGNMVGMMSTRLATDIEDPLERLQKVHDEAVNAKAHLEAQGARMMVDFSENVPAALQSLLVQISAAAGMAEKNLMMNTMVTNVPGAPVQLYMCGAKIIDSFGIGPISPGVGLFHTVNSMVMKDKGTITVAFICCRDVMPDPEFYTECIRASFDELNAVARPPAKPGRSRKQGRKGAAN
jgi:diacylglycerol O-acyltransferase / wax synthase